MKDDISGLGNGASDQGDVHASPDVRDSDSSSVDSLSYSGRISGMTEPPGAIPEGCYPFTLGEILELKLKKKFLDFMYAK